MSGARLVRQARAVVSGARPVRQGARRTQRRAVSGQAALGQAALGQAALDATLEEAALEQAALDAPQQGLPHWQRRPAHAAHLNTQYPIPSGPERIAAGHRAVAWSL